VAPIAIATAAETTSPPGAREGIGVCGPVLRSNVIEVKESCVVRGIRMILER
jgi:hypothetical protein